MTSAPLSADEILVREARPADIADIAAVINDAYAIEAAYVHGSRTSPDAVAELLDAPNATFLVAETAGAAARMLGAVWVQVRSGRGYFGPLGVDPAVQGNGLGRRLVAAVEAYCRARGCEHLDLDVLDFRDELVAYYRKLGFEVDGTAEYARPQRLRRAAKLILMTRRLG